MAVATARWLVLSLLVSAAAAAHDTKWKAGAAVGGQVVEKERRRVVAQSEAGTVTAADVADAAGTVYRLQFITMDPGALFLPVQLHADAVFYVHSGRGKVTYIQEGGSETSSLEIQRGDVYNLEQGSILYIQSYPNATRERLRIYAIFTSNAINCDDPSHPKSEAYSSVSNLLRGFEVKILRQGFGVSAEVVEAIQSAKSPQSIITYNPDQEKEEKSNWTEEIFNALWGDESPLNKKKKKDKHKKKDKKDDKSKSETFNFYSGKPDVKNCFGWSKTMTNKDLQNLKGSNIGMFMVNLTTGSMMGPHWNPKATEIAIVTHGSGIVQVVCPSIPSGTGGGHGHHDEGGRGGGDHGHHDEGGRRRGDHGHHDEGGRGGGDHGHHDEGGRRGGDHGQGGVECKNSVFRVKEGDVFVVPRFHPMAQLSFNNGSFVFVGFSTHMGENNPQFLAGEHSVLQVIGKEIVALALGQKNTTAVEKLLSAKSGSTIMACISCAEELERKAEQEEQEGGKGEREREEEERERKQREEIERKKREEEERARREKERKQREEEQGKREEEERERREEKERKQREEEERARREKERKEREEEEAARREEEERRRREEEEGGGGQGGGGGDDPREEEERRRREEEEGGGGGDDPREEEERREEEEGGRGGDDPWEEEEGDWGDTTKYRAAKNLKKRYRGRKGAVFQSA
ncbi:vicilin-like seed storage protein At4g36700 [Triticum dicoccoides]|uniref:vicilin-like seed storage protein At4g36700 n=1 Tax=Triticum dicoccoides TaxID=85692 RepID=UPI00188FF87F|nr:vicilin-like seed storage protein At4g36700 [Triticum dicoccoides]